MLLRKVMVHQPSLGCSVPLLLSRPVLVTGGTIISSKPPSYCPCSKGLLHFQNGGAGVETPKHSKNRGVLCHVRHDETAFSESEVKIAVFVSGSLKPLFKRANAFHHILRHKTLQDFWSILQLCPAGGGGGGGGVALENIHIHHLGTPY